MSFVDNDGVIRFKQRIPLRLSKENAIRHQLDGSARSRLICESNLVAHHVAQRRLSSSAIRLAMELAAMRRGCVDTHFIYEQTGR